MVARLYAILIAAAIVSGCSDDGPYWQRRNACERVHTGTWCDAHGNQVGG